MISKILIAVAARNVGLSAHEVNAILTVTAENRDAFEEAWHDYFGN